MTEVMQTWRDVPAAAELSPQARGFVQDIAARKESVRAKGQTALDNTLEFLNGTRELGLTIESAKGQLSKSQWKLAQEQFPFTERQVQGLLECARKFPEPITDIAAAMRYMPEAQLALGFGDYQGHGPQTIHDHNFALIVTKAATSFNALISKEAERTPIKTWEPSYARQCAQLLTPVADNLNRLLSQIADRAERDV